MIVSKEWLNDYLKISLSDEELEKGLTDLGLECTLIKEEFTFTNVFIGKIIEFSKHPNADKLNVCIVDIGEKEKLNIVCGAPNVKNGLYVPVAIVGATLNNGEFEIKNTKIRGIKSEGMICSEKELSISNEHDGIMILNSDLKLGLPLEEILKDKNKINFELDLAPNRGDCFSHLGVAREVAILDNNAIKNDKVEITNQINFDDFIKINIEDENVCYRYSSRIIRGVKVKKSPEWLSEKLHSIGQKSINNIVDASNYIMMSTGHPLHTFDLDKICNNKINVRFAKDEENITLLDNNSYNLTKNNLVIADDAKPIALAGVMGDNKTGISNSTKNILIESAYFKPSVVRKSAKSLGISTESSKRFERDTDIDNIIYSLDKITKLILDIADGGSVSDLKDLYVNKKQKISIEFNYERCNEFLGTSLSIENIKEIFKILNISFNQTSSICEIPSYRNDLIREVDLYEEIARVYGYDNIEPNNQFISSYDSFHKDEFLLQSKIKNYLMSNGYYENYSNSLVSEDEINYFSSIQPVQISNPLSNKMKYLRTSILPGLIKAASYNVKRSLNNFKLYETGVIHKFVSTVENKSIENDSIALLFVAGKEDHWRKKDEMDFFSIKGEIVGLFRFLNFKDISFSNAKINGISNSFSIKIKGVKVGYWGEVDKKILKNYKISSNVFCLEMDYKKINQKYFESEILFKKPNIYPIVKRDIAIEVDSSIKSYQIEEIINRKIGKYLKDVVLFDVYKGDNISSNKVSLAYTLKFQSDERTLVDKEVDDIVSNIIKILKNELNAKQR